MSQASINGASQRAAPQPSRTPTPTRASDHDVAAMNDAFAAARRKQEPAAPLTPRKGKEEKGKAADALLQQRPPMPHARTADPFERLGRETGGERDAGEQPTGQGLALQAGAAPPVPVQAAAVPPPTVDPSAFAQLMTQLWARENGKGAKDVRVQFGAATWPATGARLVRNAAGTLDVELHFAGRQTADDASLEALRGRFADQGLELGVLTAQPEPA